MKVNQLVRVFQYNGVTLPDPGASLSPEAVKDLYAATYPELVSAAIEGPEMKAGRQTFTFLKAVRDKGASSRAKWAEGLMKEYQGSRESGEPGVRIDVGGLSDEVLTCGAHVGELFKRQRRTSIQPCMVAEALPLLL